MNKNYNLKLDLQFRCNNSIMKFNQFDNNTSDFFIRITNGGNLVDIEKAIVVLAIIKPSGKVASQFVEVENGLVYADLKSNMRDEIGTYTAKAMLILEDERVVTDVISYEVEEDKIFSLLNDTVGTSEEFTLLTDMLNRLSTIEISEEQRMINEAERILSEENRKIEEAKRVEAELIRQHEEADRAKYDATRESNENIRKQNESLRLANETNRVNEEAKRVEEEANRVEAEQLRNANYNFMTEDEERRRLEANAHKEAEVLRVQAETNRVNEEAKRRTTEQARISTENTRVINENTRKANEITRQTNETHRVEAETQRQNRYNSFIADAEANANNFENYTNSAKVKEEERKSNELDRKSQEDRRVSNEVERISNENTRKANEKARQKNETSRQYVFENKVNEVDKKIVELNTTKDNFVSNINTKVDTKISEIDNVKDNFVSSVNTKVDTKISELDTAKSDMTNTVASKVNEVENRFNALTSKQQQDAEVIDARDGETSLKARLDRDIEKAKEIYAPVEGSHISTDSSSGYLKGVEILGNTIQSASNLADIRSVGDKVEGQELYEIPVLSCGKNLSTIASCGQMNPNPTAADYSLVNCEAIAYTISCDLSVSNNTNTHMYLCVAIDKNGKRTASNIINISSFNNKRAYATINIPTKGLYEFRISQNNGDTTGIYSANNIQLEEGTQATPYEPYQEDKLTILSPTPLEKVGDVRDRIIEKDGVWGVDKNVYTVTSDCFYQSSSKQLWYLDKSKVPSWMSKNVWNEISNRVICNYYGEVATYNEILVTEGIFIDHKGTNPNIIIGTNDANINSLPSDLITKYQLTTPQFIPLPHDQQIKLRTFANKTNISFGCEIEGTIKAQVPKSLGATVNTHTEQINNLNKELDRVKKLEESTVSTVTTESDFTTVEQTTNGYFEDVKLEGKTLVNLWNGIYTTKNESSLISKLNTSSQHTLIVVYNNFQGQLNIRRALKDDTVPFGYDASVVVNDVPLSGIKILLLDTTFKGSEVIDYNLYTIKKVSGECKLIILEGDHTQNPPSGYIEGLKSVGQDVDEVSVESVNSDETQSDKKRLLYYNTETQTWEKPILRQWDSIEKHTNGKYYYHVRSIEEDYVEGDESVSNYITDMTTTVKPLSQEKVYECTNIDLITYNGETNFIVESGAITPKTTLKVHNNISNVVSLLQKKVSLLESNVTSYMITQNRLMLASRYNADNVTFKVDYPSMMSEREVEIDYDLFKLIQDNIIVGPENYDVDKMLEIMDLYAMIGFITWEMWDYLYEVIDSQINPVIGDLEGAPEI